MKRISDANYFRLHRLINWLARRLFDFEVVGQENFPTQRPLLVVTNHLSIFDIPLVFMNTPVRMMMFGADKWKKTPGIAQLCDAVGTIWVTRGEADMDAMKEALALLKNNGVLGIAPEGMRSLTGQLIQGKTGPAFMATRTNATFVPYAITGVEKVAPALKRFQRAKVRMVIGKPFQLPSGRAKHEDLENYTALLMCHIAALLPPEYRGVYADHPLLPQAQAAQGVNKG